MSGLGAGVRCLIVAPVDLLSQRIGGIQSFVHGFIKFAPEDFGFEVVGVAQRDGRGPVRWRDVEVAGRPVRFLPIVSGSGGGRHRSPVPLSLRLALAAGLRRREIDTAGRVLQFHRPGTALPFVGVRAPRIQFIHFDPAQVAGAGGENRWRRLPTILRAVDRLTLGGTAAVVPVSEASAHAYESDHPRLAGRVLFVPNWWDETVFGGVAAPDRGEARRRLLTGIGAEPDAQVILFVGRLEATKDPALAIEAYLEAAAGRPNRHLVVIGDGSLRRALEEQVSRAPASTQVAFLGVLQRSEVAAWMSAADALVIASRSEAGPTVALEALASGLPVVSTAVGRIRQLVRHAETGWIAPVGDAAELARGLEWAATVPQRPINAAEEAALPYRARSVLEPLYLLHRRLVVASRAP